MDVGSAVRFPILEHLFKVYSHLLFKSLKKNWIHHCWNAWWIWNSNVYLAKLGLLLDSMMIWSSHSIFILLSQPCYPVFPWYIYSSPISVDSFYLEQRKRGSISFSVEQKIGGLFYLLLGTWSRFNVGLLFYVWVFC